MELRALAGGAVALLADAPPTAPLGRSLATLPGQVRGGAALPDVRRLRYRVRSRMSEMLTAWGVVVGQRFGGCGRRIVSEDGVALVVNEAVAHFAGLMTCGLVWVCPVCSAKIRAGRTVEVGQVLASVLDHGHGAEFATFTASHHLGQSLVSLFDGCEKAWNAMRSSRAFGRVVERFGLRLLVCTRELTWGPINGWHPHRHVAYLTERPLSVAERDQLEAALFDCWSHQLGRQGIRALRERGTVLRPITGPGGMGNYLAKVEGWSAALEMTRGDRKLARNGNRAPEALMVSAVEDGDASDFALVVEYLAATKGRRMLTWGVGVRAEFLDGAEELTDEELAAAKVGGVVLATIGRRTWGCVLRMADGPARLLEAAEQGGAEAVRTFLTEVSDSGDWSVSIESEESCP